MRLSLLAGGGGCACVDVRCSVEHVLPHLSGALVPTASSSMRLLRRSARPCESGASSSSGSHGSRTCTDQGDAADGGEKVAVVA